jgi:hypothetical protein
MADDYWTPAFQLMLEEARRSIDRQSERVQHVRERAVGLVGFGSVVAAALGLDGDPHLGVAGAIAALSFFVVAGTALFVLVPREFLFELSARRIEGWLDEPDTRRLGPNHMLYSTAVRHDEHHASNHKKLSRMYNAIAVGVAALSVETVALVTRLVL